MKEEQILVRITGQDRPGLTAGVMGILAKYDAQVLDIGQADIHSTLSLGILIRMDEMKSGLAMKELLFKATELGVNIGFSPISDDEYEDWVGHQGKNRYILMMLGRQLEARQIQAATQILATSTPSCASRVVRASSNWTSTPVPASSSRCAVNPPTVRRCSRSS